MLSTWIPMTFLRNITCVVLVCIFSCHTKEVDKHSPDHGATATPQPQMEALQDSLRRCPQSRRNRRAQVRDTRRPHGRVGQTCGTTTSSTSITCREGSVQPIYTSHTEKRNTHTSDTCTRCASVWIKKRVHIYREMSSNVNVRWTFTLLNN